MLSTIEQVERNFGPKLTASLADAADVVRAHGFGRERAWKAYRWGPTVPIPFLGDLELDTGEPSKMDEVVATQKEQLRSGIEVHWSMLLAIEQVVSEVRAKFDGEDPAIPVIRNVLDQSRKRLEEMHGEVKNYTGPFELPKPGEAEVASVREPGGASAAAESYEQWSAGCAQVFTDNELFNKALKRSLSDLRMLWNETEDGAHFPAAGTPWASSVRK